MKKPSANSVVNTPQMFYRANMKFRVEIEREEDGRWIAEIVDLPGVLAYGDTPEQAQAKVQALALRVIADRLDHGES